MSLTADLKFSGRLMRRSPGVTASAILVTALAIGAATAIFSVADGVLLKPLPFPQPERLMNVWESAPARALPALIVAPGNYFDWASQNRSFAALGAWQQATFNLASGDAEPERYSGAACDPGFFHVLGVPPALGRVFRDEETQPGKDDEVVIAWSLWRQKFGGDRNIVGRQLDLNFRRRTVIGVMPRGFEYPRQAVMWAPLAPDGVGRARRDLHQWRVIGRLRPGVSTAQAQAEFKTVAASLAQRYPDFNEGETATVVPMLDDLVQPVRTVVVLLLGTVAAVLLIACANIANLLLAKASHRRREMAIRSSLGASAAAVARQVFTESLLLSLAGGIGGLAVAYMGVHALLAMAPINTPRLDEVTFNWRAAGMAVALSAATGILFGMAPAWYCSRIDLSTMLKESARSISPRGGLRAVLAVAQVAITLVLLAGAGLLARSFYEVVRLDPGFRAENLMTMRIAPALAKYRGQTDLQRQLARGILARVASLPGVESAAVSTDVPLLGNPFYIMRFEGQPPLPPSQAPIAAYVSVSPDYFHAMGMRIVRGRGFTDRDTQDTPLVTVVSQTLANRYFPNEDPIGKRLEIGFSDPPRSRQIIGVAADVHSSGIDQDAPVQVYGAYFQMPSFPSDSVSGLAVLARTAGDPQALGGAMRAAILQVDHAQPVYAIQAMTEVVAQSIAQRRVALILLGFFACAATVLASIGIYGVMSFLVAERTNEIGIRMALGARAARVALEVERRGMVLVSAGLALGLAAALLLTRMAGPLLFHVSPRDPAIFGAACGLVVLVSMAACYFPARRASRIDPIVALREN